MNLYRIVRKNLRAYDDFVAMTVLASSPDEARKLASEFIEHAAKEYPGERFGRVWSDPNETEVCLLEIGEGPTVVATEFRHG